MDFAGRSVVITGGTGGLGSAVCRRLAADGARVAVVDLDQARCDAVAAEIGGMGIAADVGVEEDIRRVVGNVERELGPIDLFFSNAGTSGGADVFAPDEEWTRCWQTHVMASVYAARAVLPSMIERRRGYLAGTASGAALTAEPGILAYSVTKHALLDFYEVLAITHAGKGIKVSCFCPFGMLTPMLLGGVASVEELLPSVQVGLRGAVEPHVAAESVVQGLRDERFLILSHPEALTFFQRKASDYDRWIGGMRRIYG